MDIKELADANVDYVTVREVARRYQLSLNKAYSVANSLPHTLRFGTAIRVWRKDLEELERNGKEVIEHG